MINSYLITTEEIESLKSRFDFSFFAGKKVLITGGTGLVGGFLTTAIVECTRDLRSDAPVVTVTTKSKNLQNLIPIINSKNIVICSLDLSNTTPEGNFDTVIHAASPASPKHILSEEYIRLINCNIFENIISNLPNLKNFLFVSAGEVYGSDLPELVSEEYINQSPLKDHRSFYPNAKIQGELLTHKLGDYGISTHIARLFHTYGPGLREYDGRSFSDFFWNVQKNTFPVLRSFGKQVRSFSYLEDSVIGLLLLLSSNVSKPVNIGSDRPISILDFAKKISSLAGLGGEVFFDLSRINEENSPINSIVPDNSLLKSLGWVESIPMRQGITRTLNWLKTLN